MRTLIDLCTCTGRPKAFGRSLHTLMLVLGAAMAFAISGAAFAQNCCVGHGDLGCPSDPACESCVCAQDPFCCETAWDGLCAGRATGVCVADCECATGGGGECVCTVPQPAGVTGCPEHPACEAAVCACDPFCCDTQWDAFCASTGFDPDCLCGPGACGAENTAECCGPPPDPACGVGGTGNCCSANGSPFCTDGACCDAVCDIDSFCCDVEWDSLCADLAAEICPACMPFECPEGSTDEGEPCGEDTNGGCNSPPIGVTSNCCVAHGGIGCDDPACESLICGQDAFCCDTAWDGLCAGAASAQCDVCQGEQPFGSISCGETICGSAWASDGTRDTDWYKVTFETDTEVVLCGTAEFPLLIGIVNTGGVDSCAGVSAFIASATAPPDVEACLTQIVSAGTWYMFAADQGFNGNPCGSGNNGYILTLVSCEEAEIDCPGAPLACNAGAGDCFIANGTPGCDDCDCCQQICAQDAFCCGTSWDGLCAGAAVAQCGEPECGHPLTGNCCVANGSAFCDDGPCCDEVCAQDSFCCEVDWDGLCADLANDICEVCQPFDCSEATGPCCVGQPAGSVGCEDEGCCQAVCACDPFCCETQWDAFCASTGFDPDCLCGPGACGAQNTPECDEACGDVPCPGAPPACGPGAGDCFISNGTVGCDDCDCCAAICAADPFCCNTSWDGLCAGAAQDHPACDGTPPPPCDCDVATPGVPGCAANQACEDCVCADDPFCCETAWDGLCAGAAVGVCADACCDDGPPDEPAGCSLGFWKNHTENWCDSYSPDDIFDEVFGSEGQPSNCCSSQCIPTCAGAGNPTGCDDRDCQAAVCAADSFCCNTGWDGLCASAATNTHCVALCASGGAPAPLGVMGDATLHEVISSPSGGPNSVCPSRQDCNLGKQAVAALLNACAGINYPMSEDEVKDAVASAYDSGDRNEKEALKDLLDAWNNLGCPEFNSADLNQDEMVNVFDLLEVLGSWGQSEVPADINRDGIVNVFDLLEVLGNWGPAPVQYILHGDLR